jgi:hypothetical protein
MGTFFFQSSVIEINLVNKLETINKPYVSQNILKMIYFSYFHSVMTYGLLFWGQSPDSKNFQAAKENNQNHAWM